MHKDVCVWLTLIDHEIAVDSSDAVEKEVGKTFIIRVLRCDMGHDDSWTQLLGNRVRVCQAGTEFQQTQLIFRGTGGWSLGGGYFGSS